MSNEYKEELCSCAAAFARHISKFHPELVSWFVKNFPTVWEEHNEGTTTD